MTTNTDPVRALITKWRRSWADGTWTGTPRIDEVTDAIVSAKEECADELESALASAPPSAPVVDDALIAGAMEAAADACSRHVVCNEAITAAVEYALAQQPAAPVLAKHQPCGCVICTCEDEQQCQGCGAKHCGNRADHPPYIAQQPASVDGMVMVQASDLKTLAEFADRGMRGNPAKLAALRAKAILAANRKEGE